MRVHAFDGQQQRHTVREDGELTVKAEYQPGTRRVAMMPRFGMELVVSPGYERIKWYGRGPAETYVDRAFERIGVYSSASKRTTPAAATSSRPPRCT